MSKLGDQPAYPADGYVRDGNDDVYQMERCGGLTKREWLVGMAMQSLLRNSYEQGDGRSRSETCAEIVSYAIGAADAMLAELEEEESDAND